MICTPARIIASRSLIVGSRRLNIEYTRCRTCVGARMKNIAAATGNATVRRMSRIISRSATAQPAPTMALREKLSGRTTASTGIRSAGHIPALIRNKTRASATLSTSMISPENVI